MQSGMRAVRRAARVGASVAVMGLAGAVAAGAAKADEAAIPTASVHGCTSCHGPDGRSSGAIPPIAGRDAAELADLMRAFRDGRLEGSVMNRLMGPIDDAEIARIAGYFASLAGAGQ